MDPHRADDLQQRGGGLYRFQDFQYNLVMRQYVEYAALQGRRVNIDERQLLAGHLFQAQLR